MLQSTEQVERCLTNQELPVLWQLMTETELAKHFTGNATLKGADPLLQTPHKLGEATASALLLEAIAAASIWKHRGGNSSNLKIDVVDALHALHSTHFLWHSGYSLTVGAEFVPTNGIFKCDDDRFIMIESGPPYVKLERGYLNFFNCGNNREALAKAIAKFGAEELQARLSEQGLPAAVAYSKDEWYQSPQGQALINSPVIEIEKIADGPPVELSSRPEFPLNGVKVMDFTHVLAGPRSMRSLAQYGAEVLHVSSPYNRDTVSQNLLVNFGKRSAYLLLSEQKDQERMAELMRDADVFSCSYRPSVAQRFHLTPNELAADHKGLVCLSINAYGHRGPWSDRPGFDHNLQVATGFAATEGGIDSPRLSPVFYLNDFLTGYLGAAGVMTALLRRATEGGSYHVKVSLARTAMWVQDLGYISPELFSRCPLKDEYPAKLHTVQTVCGAVTELSPAVEFDSMPRCDLTMLHPFGADPPAW
ncbi:MAG: CoA transferase [Candidatus Obscuribacterales bacterium]|nr:CoA transferase [Candidatus Obscuribacterales bacterium]